MLYIHFLPIGVCSLCAIRNKYVWRVIGSCHRQVGPKKKNLKVKDFGEFEFRPQELVSDICHLYVNMSSSAAFCGAVARDGRSYSPALFTQATAVLVKISAPEAFVSRFTDVAAKIQVQRCVHETV